MSRQPTDPAGIADFVEAELARHGLDPAADGRPSARLAAEANRLIDGHEIDRTGRGLALLGEHGHLSPRTALRLLADYAAGSRLDPLRAATAEMEAGLGGSARDALVREGLLAAAALDALPRDALAHGDAQATARASRLCAGLATVPAGAVAERAAGAFLDAAKAARSAAAASGDAARVERFATAARRRSMDLGARLERARPAPRQGAERGEDR